MALYETFVCLNNIICTFIAKCNTKIFWWNLVDMLLKPQKSWL